MTQSKKIKVKVLENGNHKVSLSLPIKAIVNLATLMPPHVVSKLTEKNIDLNEIIDKVKSSNYEPQTLFEMESGEKSYRVWIE